MNELVKMKELAGCRIEKDGKTLLLHRIKHNYWELPGGKIDLGETPIQAAIRETKEETGCDVKIIEELKPIIYEFLGKTVKSHQFKARIINGEPRVTEPDVFDDIKYVDIKKEKDIAPNLKVKIK
ncbi:MAG: NUDIX domain-containing protein [Nanoarchaeota archaeon]|nr:NUDIX domain-containing protein [Nanoarchaeota archaeon]MBU1269708.1 NUDIX domain-containing protein [Nanoarchaeota archaeon]MBU1604009.1 NUDIX domain-containing protein [Nanoarchaeota archaeon]MBU2442526.1 NUDIX domain-containing protein [Nanoarchaeota archaeon]